MVFCNKALVDADFTLFDGHNPYFNRWFSAIFEQKTINKEDKMSQSLF